MSGLYFLCDGRFAGKEGVCSGKLTIGVVHDRRRLRCISGAVRRIETEYYESSITTYLLDVLDSQSRVVCPVSTVSKTPVTFLS
jgi:hypothetical protein